MTLTRRDVIDLLDRHDVRPSRALGQNFVVDPNTVRRIVRLAELEPAMPVLEIGPGLGSLTLALTDEGHTVTAVELDRHLLPALAEVTADRPVTVVHADALRVDWDATLASSPRWALVANLPYNVGTSLVLDLLERVPQVDPMLVMVQSEVGERLAAAPGTEAYGIPSVKLAYRASARVVGRVPPTVFLPRPRVESALVRITRRPVPAVGADPVVLFALIDRAFGQRRKMLRRSLADVVSPAAFEAAGIDPADRPERLGIEAWGRLADAVAAAGGSVGS